MRTRGTQISAPRAAACGPNLQTEKFTSPMWSPITTVRLRRKHSMFSFDSNWLCDSINYFFFTTHHVISVQVLRWYHFSFLKQALHRGNNELTVSTLTWRKTFFVGRTLFLFSSFCSFPGALHHWARPAVLQWRFLHPFHQAEQRERVSEHPVAQRVTLCKLHILSEKLQYAHPEPNICIVEKIYQFKTIN